MGSRTIAEVFREIGGWTDIPSELGRRNIKGNRDDCSACPMAVFIAGEVDPRYFDEVAVDTPHTRFYKDGSLIVTMSNPPRMDSFIRNFDDHEYPELDKAPVDPEELDYYFSGTSYPGEAMDLF